ncbi:MAG TPA: UDP-N-acetyl glucosamine 2-epimerase, partial [bacterium]|nr:UDP-N-acetyl glucosamine 2-epimerase [bacterium]
AAAKLHLPIAHVEAGLRSFNREMPEEINRIIADEISTLLFCPTATAVDNLRREGVTSGVFLTGDVMLDALMRYREKPSGGPALLQSLNLNPGGYRLLTIHRAGNTDSVSNLGSLLAALGESGTPIVFPVHPRTRGRISEAGLAVAKNIRCIDPVGYLEMLFLERNADLILTDSGGIQKEAYIFGVPCVTLREETEWVETVAAGWNTLAGTAPETILSALLRSRPKSERPKIFGSGTSSALITDILLDFLARGSA